METGTEGPNHFCLWGETADEYFRAWGVKTPRARPAGLITFLFQFFLSSVNYDFNFYMYSFKDIHIYLELEIITE